MRNQSNPSWTSLALYTIAAMFAAAVVSFPLGLFYLGLGSLPSWFVPAAVITVAYLGFKALHIGLISPLLSFMGATFASCVFIGLVVQGVIIGFTPNMAELLRMAGIFIAVALIGSAYIEPILLTLKERRRSQTDRTKEAKEDI